MANITIRGLPDHVYEAMKKRAAENRRSLNQELISTIEEMASAYGAPPSVTLDDLRAFHQKTRRMKLTEREVNAAKQAGRR